MTEIDPTSMVQVLLERVEPDRNMARYYVLSIERTLFCENTLIRQWGRIGSLGQTRHEFFDAHAGAREALDDWLFRKARRGYVLA